MGGSEPAPSSAAASAAAVSAYDGPERTLKYGFVDQGSGVATGVVGIAQQQGYFDEELSKIKTKIEILPFTGAGPAINAALASNSLDAGLIGDVPALVSKASGVNTVLVGGSVADANTYLVAQAGKGYKSIQDLKGKRVATQIGAYMQRVLYLMLEDAGLTVNDIQFVNMTAKDAVSALASKSVDAIVVSGTQSYTLASQGLGELLESTENHPDWLNSSGTLFRAEYTKENPDVVRAFLKALLRAKEYAEKNPQDLRALQVKAGTPEKVLDLVYPDLTDYSTGVEATPDVIKILKSVNQFLTDNKLSTNAVDVDAWYDPSFIEGAKKELAAK